MSKLVARPRRAELGDVDHVRDHMLRIANAPETRMCPSGKVIQREHLVNTVGTGQYIQIVPHKGQVAALVMCEEFPDFIPNEGWISYSVESPFRYGDNFRYEGVNLMDAMIESCISWALLYTKWTGLMACVQADNTASLRLLKSAGFSHQGSCRAPGQYCPITPNQFWKLPLLRLM